MKITDKMRLDTIINTAKWAMQGGGRHMALGWLCSRNDIDAAIRAERRPKR